MPDVFPLHLFPEGALAQSVITCVWVGVFVVVFFNLRFGWVLSGLVVPGYLVPLLLVKPTSAAVVVAESIVTWLVVYLFSEIGSRARIWSNLFGRDRFFGLLLVSILVRVVFDGYLLPSLAAYLDARYQVQVDLRNDLHSFGLIIVCLLANQYWKTGLLRGLPVSVITIGTTWAIVRYVLMPFTNFSIGELSYLYEDVAASILSSPKSYLILVLTALIASRMNLRYGWDFNGILIPSLLALQWYQPEKILISFVEAFIICALAVAVLRLPLFRQTNIEGGRKLLLFFNLSFAWKLLLGYALVTWAPAVKVSDLYGFGYLLPTLLAIKMHDKAAYVRVTRVTLQTSFTALLVASVLAFGLTRLPAFGAREGAVAGPTSIRRIDDAALAEVLGEAKLDLYERATLQELTRPYPAEIETFERALERIAGDAPSEDGAVQRAAAELGTLGFEVLVSPRWLILHDRSGHGWGTYVIARGVADGVVIELPAPLERAQLIEGGAALFQATGAAALAVAGNAIRLNQNRDPAVSLDHATLFQAFHRHFAARHDVVQLRGAPRSARGKVQSSLWVSRGLPEGLDVNLLNSALEAYDVVWDAPVGTNVQRDATPGGFAELFLASRDVRSLVAAAAGAGRANFIAQRERAGGFQRIAEARRIEGYLQQWLLDNKSVIARRGSESYEPPTPGDLLYFDDQVLTPLLGWIERPEADVLAGVASAAVVLDYRLVRYTELATGDEFLVLEPTGRGPARHWGLYAFRVTRPENHMVEVPRPLYEVGSFEFGIALFEQLRARTILIAGAHPYANLDGSADVIRGNNRRSLFNLVNQVVVRERGNTPLLVTQVRSFGYREGLPAPSADVLVSTRFASPIEPAGVGKQLLDQLEASGLAWQYVDGSLATAGYEAYFTIQARYLDLSRNKEFVTLWLSPAARGAYRRQGDDQQMLAQLRAVGIPLSEADLYRWLQGRECGCVGVSGELRDALEAYRLSRDAARLHALAAGRRDVRFEAVLDANSQQLFLALSEPAGGVLALVNLGYARGGRLSARWPLERAAVQGFIEQRAAWLTFTAGGRT